ncbi:MAG: glycosyltransferase [archaeon]
MKQQKNIPEKPFVSVIITTFGLRNSIKKTIESVLNSSYRNFELIVVNDGAEINLKPEGFHIINQEHKGLAAARNTGIRNSKGKFIAFIDDDAVAEKNWLEELVLSFVSDGVGAVSGTAIEYFDKPETNVFWTCNNFGLIKVNPAEMKKNDFIVVHGCNMAFSRKALEEVNFIDENFTFYFDEIDLSFRLLKKGFKIINNRKAVVHHFIKSNARFGNKFEFGKFKYYFALKNFNSRFFFLFLVLNDLPFLLNDLKESVKLFLKGKMGFRRLLQDIYFIFAGRVSGTRKAFIDFSG